MNKIDIDLLKRLSMAFGPSGSEDKIRNIIKEEIKGYVDEINIDTLGNLIAIKKGDGKKIMIASHMDEIGIMVTNIDEKGFLRFTNIGGVSAFSSLYQRVMFVDGTIGILSMENLDNMKELKLDKMFIDIGAKTKEEAMAKVKVGDVACFYTPFVESGDNIISKAMDDRVGCYIAIESLKRLKDCSNEVYFVFTVQEEVGLRGAKTAAYALDPDYGIAIDVTMTGDTPKAKTMDITMGEGVAIKVKDSSILAHPTVKNTMVNMAKKYDIPYQLEVLEAGGTDSGAIHLSRSGVPSGVISIPCRYVHSPSEMVSKKDLVNAITLLVKTVEEM